MACDNWIVLASMVSGLTFGQGCCMQNDCAGTTVLVVQDEYGTLLSESKGVTIEPSTSASACDAAKRCTFDIPSSGNFTVAYPGYKPTTVHVTPAKDSCGNQVDQTITVKLVPQSGTETPVPKHTLGASCGD